MQVEESGPRSVTHCIGTSRGIHDVREQHRCQKPICCRRRSAASEELLHDAEDQIGLLRLWHYVATGNLDEASIRNAIGELTDRNHWLMPVFSPMKDER